MGDEIAERPVTRRWKLGTLSLFVSPAVTVVLLVLTLRHRQYNEPFFVCSAYYVLLALITLRAGVQLSGLAEAPSFCGWLKENRAGLAVTGMVSAVALLAVQPAFRVLADEANLVGVSKNLFFHKTANFAVTGKWYFENYWNLNEATDRRPALFPFLVSLLHAVRGYHFENAFHVNAIVFVLFVFSSYRLAKCLGGELFGVASAILVAANPITLVSARSAGFDFLSTFMLLIVVQSFHDYVAQPAPRRLALLVLNLCLLAHVRYEGWAFFGATAVVTLAHRVVKRAHLRGFGFVYSLVPLFLLPRWWQSVAKANDAEQPISASLFSFSGLWRNVGEYVRIVARPMNFDGPHSPWLLILGAGGLALVMLRVVRGLHAKELTPHHLRLLVLVSVLLGLDAVICFAYGAGKPLHPASARLFIWLDTFVSFAAAWLLTALGRRLAGRLATVASGLGGPLAVGACFALFAMHVPIASEARFVNALILTRQAAISWRFFERLGEKRILILSDRPGLFTIMDYGALDISLASADRSPLLELSRHLYQDIYLVQEVDLETGRPLPAFSPWPDLPTETVLEFQNTDSRSVRISRVRKAGEQATAGG